MPKRIRKALGVVGKLMSIVPDTTEIIGKTIDNSRPIIEKRMEQKHEKEMQLRTIDDVINLPVDQAQAHLEQLGFVVATIPAKPHKKWLHSNLSEVVAMSPKSGKYKIGSLIKLYYITVDVLEKSQDLLDQENLRTVERNQKIADTFESVKHIRFPFKKWR
ncbi:TPA: PASTA domain-containing protein [Streptococcus pyogenes]|nr:PASTA domain-containing protein [Streptococcus pyogenes]HER4805675.1 PASTA domain-containing protein [Streptococcus pyogenes NGAS057]